MTRTPSYVYIMNRENLYTSVLISDSGHQPYIRKADCANHLISSTLQGT
ncbi:hypothetical protein HMPREF9303_0654 [Prevotella denticola CRIS 18C-A]|uniref:Uncharacterized protein n=1 Tax=Prevotella denticola CRIS 18C-A TaxID=944557 RepID=F0H8H9_9BACT|nr:hypothetical protein HMPREF9303_0654 [Prevotella denticola CRIS 18C-A]